MTRDGASGRAIRRQWKRAAALLLTALALGCGAMSNPETRQSKTLDWDLSQGHGVERINWPPERDTNALSFMDAEVRIKLPGDKIFQGRMKDVTVTRSGSEIESVALHSEPKALDETYAGARQLAKEWGFDSQSLEQWYAQRKSETKPDTYATFGTFRNDLQPSLALRLLHSFEDSAPWLISFEINWVPSN